MKSQYSLRLRVANMISVQRQDFDLALEHAALQEPGHTGAVVTFVGCVREFADSVENNNGSFYLQHYPGMTEKVLNQIESDALDKWQIQTVRIIHRVGDLKTGDNIVFVGVSARHRKHAFAACEYIIDILKTQAPFWKKEGATWVAANHADQYAADHWLANKIPTANE